MPSSPVQDLSSLLPGWSRADASALDKLMPVVYAELRQICGCPMRLPSFDLIIQVNVCDMPRSYVLAHQENEPVGMKP